MDAPAGEETSVEVQPERSVRAMAMEAKAAATRMLEVYILVRSDVVVVCGWVLLVYGLAVKTSDGLLLCFCVCKRM